MPKQSKKHAPRAEKSAVAAAVAAPSLVMEGTTPNSNAAATATTQTSRASERSEIPSSEKEMVVNPKDAELTDLPYATTATKAPPRVPQAAGKNNGDIENGSAKTASRSHKILTSPKAQADTLSTAKNLAPPSSTAPSDAVGLKSGAPSDPNYNRKTTASATTTDKVVPLHTAAPTEPQGEPESHEDRAETAAPKPPSAAAVDDTSNNENNNKPEESKAATTTTVPPKVATVHPTGNCNKMFPQKTSVAKASAPDDRTVAERMSSDSSSAHYPEIQEYSAPGASRPPLQRLRKFSAATQQFQVHPDTDSVKHGKENDANATTTAGGFPDSAPHYKDDVEPPKASRRQPKQQLERRIEACASPSSPGADTRPPSSDSTTPSRASEADTSPPKMIGDSSFYDKNPDHREVADILDGTTNRKKESYKAATSILAERPLQEEDFLHEDGMLRLELKGLTFGLFNMLSLWYWCIFTAEMGENFQDLKHSLNPDKKNQPVHSVDNKSPPTRRTFPSGILFPVGGPCCRSRMEQAEMWGTHAQNKISGWNSTNAEMYLKKGKLCVQNSSHFVGIVSDVDLTHQLLSNRFDYNEDSEVQMPTNKTDRKYERKKRVDAFGEPPIAPGTIDPEERARQFKRFLLPAINRQIERIREILYMLKDPRAELITNARLTSLFYKIYCKILEIPQAPIIDEDLLHEYPTSILPETPLLGKQLISALYATAEPFIRLPLEEETSAEQQDDLFIVEDEDEDEDEDEGEEEYDYDFSVEEV